MSEFEDWRNCYQPINFLKGVNVTKATMDLFKQLCEDSHHWNGVPLFQGNNSQRGNLTALKIARLVTTCVEDGNAWVFFTEEGFAYAKSSGFDICKG